MSQYEPSEMDRLEAQGALRRFETAAGVRYLDLATPYGSLRFNFDEFEDPAIVDAIVEFLTDADEAES